GGAQNGGAPSADLSLPAEPAVVLRVPLLLLAAFFAGAFFVAAVFFAAAFFAGAFFAAAFFGAAAALPDLPAPLRKPRLAPRSGALTMIPSHSARVSEVGSRSFGI